MKKHIFLTGEIQIGKSTAIRQFLESSGAHADGFLTRFYTQEQQLLQRHELQRELYLYRFDSKLGESEGRLAVKMNRPDIEVFVETFAVHGTGIVRNSGASGLIIMDELGAFEEKALEFKAAVFEKLDGVVPVLGVVKKRDSPFLDAVRAHPNVEVIEVTVENRDGIPQLLRERFCV